MHETKASRRHSSTHHPTRRRTFQPLRSSPSALSTTPRRRIRSPSVPYATTSPRIPDRHPSSSPRRHVLLCWADPLLPSCHCSRRSRRPRARLLCLLSLQQWPLSHCLYLLTYSLLPPLAPLPPLSSFFFFFLI